MSIGVTPTRSDRVSSEFPRKRIGIVGCGPRGLQCLETLTRKCSQEQLRSLEVIVFETASHPGAGAVYSPTQSKVLRMNFATQYIDFWRVDPAQPTSYSGSLIGWLEQNHPQWAKADCYVPRAIVGEYLSHCFHEVVERFPASHVKIAKQQVVNVQPSRHAWLIETDGGQSLQVDNVVLTTGHEGLRVNDCCNSYDSSSTFVFPVDRKLSPRVIAPKSRVLIQGFGLTAIDAILFLTEGRGGTFRRDPHSRCQLRFNDTNLTPTRIHVESRTGRPMLAKPTAAIEPVSDDFWYDARSRMHELSSQHGMLNFVRDVWPVITERTAKLVNATGPQVTPSNVDRWFRSWSRSVFDGKLAYDAMQQSVEVAKAKRAPNIAFAIGQVWRQLYPPLVDLISYGGLGRGQWSVFQSIAQEMERIAFGPPAENVDKLLALIDAGVLVVNPPKQQSKGKSKRISHDPYDFRLSAVIASPRQARQDGPIQRLLDQGILQRDPVTYGIQVDETGAPLGSPGGLAVFGRATEGWLLGNDTLTRTMHRQMEHWADMLAVRWNSKQAI